MNKKEYVIVEKYPTNDLPNSTNKIAQKANNNELAGVLYKIAQVYIKVYYRAYNMPNRSDQNG